MKFDYMDEKCPKCGHNDLNWRIEGSVIIYNLYTCKKCQSSFRVTTAEAPDITPESGHKVTMLPDECAKCGEKSGAYSHPCSCMAPSCTWGSICTPCTFLDPDWNATTAMVVS